MSERTPEELAAAIADALRREDTTTLEALVAKLELSLAAEGWRAWLDLMFPGYVRSGFGHHHEEFWRWVWSARYGVAIDPFVAVWARGGAKSTSAEIATAALGCRQIRRYTLYVCRTQDQADDHVANIAGMVETPTVSRLYPLVARRRVGKYGHSKGWRRNRLSTESGWTVDALGLDTAARGLKIEEFRPDSLVLDDIDGTLDTIATVEKLEATLTRAVLPTLVDSALVIAIQNLVHPESIFSRLVDGRAEYLAGRIVSGPIPAIRGLAVERDEEGRHSIVAGEPTWSGQSLEACQVLLDRMAITAFRAECQHEVGETGGGIFRSHLFRYCAPEDVPELVTIVVWCDPAVTDKPSSSANGIQADGIARDGTIYRLFSSEEHSSPEETLRLAVRTALSLNAESVGVETDQGGDVWRSAYRATISDLGIDEYDAPTFRSEKAGSGHGPKAHRASQMLADYERGRIVHVTNGSHETLEASLLRFPHEPLDLTDAAYWSWWDLRRSGGPAETSGARVARARLPA